MSEELGIIHDVQDEPLVFSKSLFDLFIKNKQFQALTLYQLYCYVAKWQKTNQVYATNEYMGKLMKVSSRTVMRYKNLLFKLGLIERVREKNNSNQIIGHYVKVNFIWSTRKSYQNHVKTDVCGGVTNQSDTSGSMGVTSQSDKPPHCHSCHTIALSANNKSALSAVNKSSSSSEGEFSDGDEIENEEIDDWEDGELIDESFPDDESENPVDDDVEIESDDFEDEDEKSVDETPEDGGREVGKLSREHENRLRLLLSGLQKHGCGLRSHIGLLTVAMREFPNDADAGTVVAALEAEWEHYRPSSAWQSGAWAMKEFIPNARMKYLDILEQQKTAEDEAEQKNRALKKYLNSRKYDFQSDYERYLNQPYFDMDTDAKRFAERFKNKPLNAMPVKLREDFLRWSR